jgi:hypothetical protein
MHAGTSRDENSAQGLSCQLKFVHGVGLVGVGLYIIKKIRVVMLNVEALCLSLDPLKPERELLP